MAISKNIKKAVLFIVLLAVLFAVFMVKISNDVKLSIIKYGNIELSAREKGIVIRDEQVVNSNTDGYVKFAAQSGTRVPKGLTLARIYKKDYIGKYKKQLTNIDKKITDKIYNTNYNSAKQTFSQDISKLNSNINKQLKSIQYSISDEEYNSLYDLKDSINRTVKKRYDIVKILGANGESTDIDTMNKEKDHLQQLISTYEEDISCEQPAMFSEYIDGLENKLSLVNYPKMNVKTIDEIISDGDKRGSRAFKARMGKPLFKMIKDYHWKLLCTMPEEQTKHMDINQPVTIYAGNNNEPISAYVQQKRKAGDKYIVVFNCSDMIQNVYHDRVISFKVVKASYSGFKVQSRAVTTRYVADIYENKINTDTIDKNQTCELYLDKEKDPINVKLINTMKVNNKKHLIFITLDDNIILKSNNLVGLKFNGNYYSIQHKDYSMHRIHGIYVFKLGVIRYCPVDFTVEDGNDAIINNVLDVDPNKEIKYYDKVITNINSISSSDVVN